MKSIIQVLEVQELPQVLKDLKLEIFIKNKKKRLTKKNIFVKKIK